MRRILFAAAAVLAFSVAGQSAFAEHQRGFSPSPYSGVYRSYSYGPSYGCSPYGGGYQQVYRSYRSPYGYSPYWGNSYYPYSRNGVSVQGRNFGVRINF